MDGVAALDCCIEIGFDFGSLNCARADHLDQFVALGHDPRQLLFEVAPLGALLFANRGELSRIFLAEHVEQFWIEQIIAQPREDHVFQAFVRHGEPVGAESLVLIGRAAEMIARVLRVSAATYAAFDNARDQILDRPVLPVGAFDRHAAILLALDPIPQRLVHDAQMLSLVHNPTFLRIDPNDALMSVGVAILSHAVPHDFAGIHLVIDDAGAALAIAGD